MGRDFQFTQGRSDRLYGEGQDLGELRPHYLGEQPSEQAPKRPNPMTAWCQPAGVRSAELSDSNRDIPALRQHGVKDRFQSEAFAEQLGANGS